MIEEGSISKEIGSHMHSSVDNPLEHPDIENDRN